MTIKAWIPATPPQQAQAQQGFPTNSAVAAGTNQATAYQIPTDFVVFTTVGSGTGCLLLGAQDTTATPGPCTEADTVTIVNHGANALTVYPQVGGKIANGSTNAGLSVPANKTAFFVYIGSGGWAASVSS